MPTKEIKVNEKFVGVFPLEFKDAGKTAAGEIPDTIHLIPVGQWDHDGYGKILITPSDIKEFAANFQAGLRKGVFITAGHEMFTEQPAVGWVQEVEAREDGLWGRVEWTKLGKDILNDKQFKFISPEFCPVYEDAETHLLYKNVLTGAALTKSPYFKELEAVVFSEPKFNQKFNEPKMTIDEILAKAKEDLNDEEKAFLKEKAGELTEEQKAEYGDIITDGDGGDGDKGGDDAAKAEADKAAADAAAAEAGKVEASENVMVNAAEFKKLQEMADQGAQAFKELNEAKVNAAVSSLVFSDSNKAGKFMPKSKAAIKTFMEGLNEAQRVAFSELINQIPKAGLFDEKGGEGTDEASNQKAVDAKVAEIQKANPTMKYSEALKKAFAENPELAKAHEEGEEL